MPPPPSSPPGAAPGRQIEPSRAGPAAAMYGECLRNRAGVVRDPRVGFRAPPPPCAPAPVFFGGARPVPGLDPPPLLGVSPFWGGGIPVLYRAVNLAVFCGVPPRGGLGEPRSYIGLCDPRVAGGCLLFGVGAPPSWARPQLLGGDRFLGPGGGLWSVLGPCIPLVTGGRPLCGVGTHRVVP